MTFIKTILFPIAVCAALLLPEYELWCLDDDWSEASDNALPLSAVGSGVGGITFLLCPVVRSDDDGEDD